MEDDRHDVGSRFVTDQALALQGCNKYAMSGSRDCGRSPYGFLSGAIAIHSP
ncbi:hypothetical protein FLM9_72 [Candidatus Synechococcus spongiarum]|uniref:Uncharacterized protein n=1 Tax=Candidatus Synechococcus spongiarum TaxID=431041 RepID=A0A170T3P1_9SYNE|nr:hypothetical protein FLM9_72 [Candidatus Synechococcus spongiarum]